MFPLVTAKVTPLARPQPQVEDQDSRFTVLHYRSLVHDMGLQELQERQKRQKRQEYQERRVAGTQTASDGPPMLVRED
ncbi:hypothetical protein E5D57_002463 [Metarhizium anisopliae]|nr:hypothetical protein E5D57_002463 [Metarhizium anisopliae]